jgi:N-lysine methyltransferase SETD6
MFWSQAELAELQASAVVSKIGKAESEAAWNETILPLMLQHPVAFPVNADDEEAKRKELIRLSHLAGSLIMAYAFDIDKEGESRDATEDASDDSSLVEDEEGNPLKGMVPLADMLNADADRNNVSCHSSSI